MSHEVFQYSVFGGGELYVHSAALDLMSGRIE
jgi:hypothetical protein